MSTISTGSLEIRLCCVVAMTVAWHQLWEQQQRPNAQQVAMQCIGSLALNRMVCCLHACNCLLLFLYLTLAHSLTHTLQYNTIQYMQITEHACFALYYGAAIDFQPIYRRNDAVSTKVQIKVNNIPACSIHCNSLSFFLFFA